MEFYPCMDDLPSEVISCIFEYLPLSDIKEARLVCKRWYDASMVSQILRREKMVCKIGRSDQFQRTFLTSTRKFYHLLIMERASDKAEEIASSSIWNNEHFWNKFGPKLRSLSLERCTLSTEELFGVLHYCTGIRSLRICDWKCTRRSQYFRSEPVTELLSLQSLRIGCSSNAKQLFKDLVICAPNLETLDLRDAPEVDMEFDPLMYEDVIGYVQNNYHRTFHLQLMLMWRDRFEDVERLVALPNSRLRVLEFYKTSTVPQSWCNLFIGQRWLQKLTLTCNIDDELFDTVCNNLPNLLDLDMSCACDLIHSVQSLALLKNLTSLRMVLCYKMNRESFLSGLCSDVNTRLKKLVINVLDLPCDVIMELARTHPALTSLSLIRCRGLDDRSVQAIFWYLEALETLILDRCEFLSDAGLGGMVMPQCDVERIDGRPPIPTGYSVCRLKNLRLLSVGSCNINGSVFEAGLPLTDVRHLVLNHNFGITSEAFERLFEMNPRIERLEVVNCFAVTNQLLEVMKNKLPRLNFLDVSGCCKVTSGAIHSFLSDRKITLMQ